MGDVLGGGSRRRVQKLAVTTESTRVAKRKCRQLAPMIERGSPPPMVVAAI